MKNIHELKEQAVYELLIASSEVLGMTVSDFHVHLEDNNKDRFTFNNMVIDRVNELMGAR